jgi:hypothetical protein
MRRLYKRQGKQQMCYYTNWTENVPKNRIPHTSVNRYSFNNRMLSNAQSQNTKCEPRPNILRTLNSLRPNDLRPSALFTCNWTSTKFYPQRSFLWLVCVSDQRQNISLYSIDWLVFIIQVYWLYGTIWIRLVFISVGLIFVAEPSLKYSLFRKISSDLLICVPSGSHIILQTLRFQKFSGVAFSSVKPYESVDNWVYILEGAVYFTRMIGIPVCLEECFPNFRPWTSP